MNLPGVGILLKSLRLRVCPACGGYKAAFNPLCGGCYSRVPAHLRVTRHTRMGSAGDGSYQRGLAACLAFLGVTVPFWPGQDAHKARAERLIEKDPGAEFEKRVSDAGLFPAGSERKV